MIWATQKKKCAHIIGMNWFKFKTYWIQFRGCWHLIGCVLPAQGNSISLIPIGTNPSLVVCAAICFYNVLIFKFSRHSCTHPFGVCTFIFFYPNICFVIQIFELGESLKNKVNFNSGWMIKQENAGCIILHGF